MEKLKDKFKSEVNATINYLFNDDKLLSTDPTFHATGGAGKWRENIIELRDLFLLLEQRRKQQRKQSKYEAIYTIAGNVKKFVTTADSFSLAKKEFEDKLPESEIIEEFEWRENDKVIYSYFKP